LLINLPKDSHILYQKIQLIIYFFFKYAIALILFFIHACLFAALFDHLFISSFDRTTPTSSLKTILHPEGVCYASKIISLKLKYFKPQLKKDDLIIFQFIEFSFLYVYSFHELCENILENRLNFYLEQVILWQFFDQYCVF